MRTLESVLGFALSSQCLPVHPLSVILLIWVLSSTTKVIVPFKSEIKKELQPSIDNQY